MKKLNYLMAIISIVATLCSCNSKVKEAREQLRQEVEESNGDCPYYINDYTCISEIVFNEDANAVQYIAVYNDSIISPDAFANNSGDIRTTSMMSMISTGQDLLNKLADAEMNLDYIYRAEISEEETTIHFSLEDIRDMLSKSTTDRERYQTILANNIDMERKDCPQDLGDGLIMEDIFEEGSDVVYVYSVDGESVTALSEIYGTVKESVISSLTEATDFATHQTIEALKYLGRDLVFRYRSTDSDEVMDIRIHPDEL